MTEEMSIDAASTPRIDMCHDAFLRFREEINTDNDRREALRAIVRELEECSRDVLYILQRAHPPADTAQLCKQARQVIANRAVSGYAKLAKECNPIELYHKYADIFRFCNQRFAFICAFLVYLETGKLASQEDVARMLNVGLKLSDGIYIDIEEYLHGLLQLSSELARFTVNAVSAGSYVRAFHIHSFVCSLDQAFRLLNLKNDNLRRKFDALKYDVQKVEQVVYDLTIREKKPTDAELAALYPNSELKV